MSYIFIKAKMNVILIMSKERRLPAIVLTACSPYILNMGIFAANISIFFSYAIGRNPVIWSLYLLICLISHLF